MANGYEQFFKKAKENSTDGAVRSGVQKRFVMDREPQDRVIKSENSRAELIRELRARVKKRRARRPRQLPKMFLTVCILGSGLAGFGMTNHENLEKWMSSFEIAVLGQAHAEEAAKDAQPAAAKTDEKKDGDAKDGKTADKSKDKSAEGAQSAVSATDWKDEDVNHFKKLVDRKKELDAREEELNRQESELQAQRDDLEKKLKSLESTRTNISNVLQEKVAEDEKKVATLVDVYSNMKPVQAAKVLETMDEDLAVQILGRMKKKNAAEVLNLMKPEKAQNFSEKFAGYRKN